MVQDRISDSVYRTSFVSVRIRYNRMDGHADSTEHQGYYRGTVPDDRLFHGKLFHSGYLHGLRKQYALKKVVSLIFLTPKEQCHIN